MQKISTVEATTSKFSRRASCDVVDISWSRVEGASARTINALSNPRAMMLTHFLNFIAPLRRGTNRPLRIYGLRPQAGVTQLSSGQPPTVTPVAIRTRFDPSAFIVKMSRLPSVLSRSLAKTICVPSGE